MKHWDTTTWMLQPVLNASFRNGIWATFLHQTLARVWAKGIAELNLNLIPLHWEVKKHVAFFLQVFWKLLLHTVRGRLCLIIVQEKVIFPLCTSDIEY